MKNKASTMVCIAALFISLVLCGTQATAMLHWAPPSPANGATVPACVGQEAVLPWNYTLDSGDLEQDIRWFVANDHSNQMIAVFTFGNFVVMPAFSGRMRHLGNAELALDHVTFQDAGNYSVDVAVHHADGTYVNGHRSAYLLIAAPPATRSGELVISQSRHAVYNNVTADWQVELTCGVFADLGQPPVDVLWKTPSGSSLPSSNYDNGYFELLLDNPVEGGNYSCRLNPSSPATVCFHDDDPMMKEVKVTVDEVKARLTLIEANQGALQSEMRMENAELKNKNADLTQHVHSLETKLDQYHRDNTNLTNYVHNLQAELTHFHEAATARVSFHARLSSSVQVNYGNPVILTNVYSNEGGSYSNTTGRFTVPRNGTYAFFTSVETGSSNLQVARVYIMVDNTDICDTYSYYSGNIQGSSCHAVLHLVQGQRVWLKAPDNSYYWYPGTVFSGFLLNADE